MWHIRMKERSKDKGVDLIDNKYIVKIINWIQESCLYMKADWRGGSNFGGLGDDEQKLNFLIDNYFW